MAEILRLASASDSDGREGLTLAEIERVASEIGLDADAVRAASRKIDESRSTAPKMPLSWVPAAESFERICEGTLDDGGWAELVEDARRGFVLNGETSATNGAREWIGKYEFLNARLTVTERNGQSRVRVHVDRYGSSAMSFMVYLIGAILSLAFSLSLKTAFTPLIWTALVALIWILVVRIQSSFAAKNREAARAVLDAFEGLVQTSLNLSGSQVLHDPDDVRDKLNQGH